MEAKENKYDYKHYYSDLYDKFHSETIKRFSENKIELDVTFELTENEFNKIMRSKEVLLRGELYNMIYPIQMDHSTFPKKIEFKLIKKPLTNS